MTDIKKIEELIEAGTKAKSGTWYLKRQVYGCSENDEMDDLEIVTSTSALGLGYSVKDIDFITQAANARPEIKAMLEDNKKQAGMIAILLSGLCDISKQYKSDEWEEEGDTEDGYDLIIDTARDCLIEISGRENDDKTEDPYEYKHITVGRKSTSAELEYTMDGEWEELNYEFFRDDYTDNYKFRKLKDEG